MAKEAERLLSGTGWLPEPLRMMAADNAAPQIGADDDTGDLRTFFANDDNAALSDVESTAIE